MENNEIKLNKNLYEEIAKRGTFTSYYNVPIEKIPVVEKPYLRGYETAEDYQKEMMAKSIEKEQPVSVEKFIEEPKCYNPVQEVKVEKIDLGPLPQSAPNSGVILGDSKLPWMVGKRGKYLDFFRGLIMYDKDGNEVVDVFDGTEKHHGPRIYEIARDNFNTTIINEQLPMQNAEHANNEGITVLLLEGTTMQIYLPEKISKETIEEILVQLERRQNYEFFMAINGSVASIPNYNELGLEEGKWSYDKLVEFFKAKLKELGQEETSEEELQREQERKAELYERYSYISALLKYLMDNEITIDDYYRQLANEYRNNLELTAREVERLNPFLTAEDIRLLIGSNDENIIEYFTSAMRKIVELNLEMLKEKQDDKEDNNIEEQEEVEEEKLPPLTGEEYINILLNYVNENHITIEDYYRNLALSYIHDKEPVIEEFERRNPFLTEEDIERLVTSEDSQMPNYFANTMSRVIQLNLEEMLANKKEAGKTTAEEDETLTRDDIKEAIDDELDKELDEEDIKEVIDEELDDVEENKSHIEDMPLDILDNLNGFGVIKESDKTNIYTYDAKDKDSLANRRVYQNINIKSGYYVNIMQFMSSLIDSVITKYEDTIGIEFVKEDGQRIEYETLMESIFQEVKEAGTIRLGTEYKENPVSSYSELEERYDELETKDMGNTTLLKGHYVNKEALIKALSKYKLNVITTEMNYNEQPIEKTR